MPERHVMLHREGSVAFLTLCTPPKNEMGAAFFEDLLRLVPAIEQLRVKGLVVRGQGRHFSSGANLRDLRAMLGKENAVEGMRSLRDNSKGFGSLAALPFPTVAAIQGCCLGSGLELALACTFRVAANNAVLGLPEATFGLLPGCGGTVRLTRLAGYRKAIELILAGESLLASDALDAGLVDAVVDKSKLVSTAMRFIERLG